MKKNQGGLRRQQIEEIAKGWDRSLELDPRHVEAWILTEYATLDGLTARAFSFEVRRAMRATVEAGPKLSEQLAESFGL